MPGNRWGDDELRRYLLRADEVRWTEPEQADERRAECVREMARVVPGLQRRLLEQTGAPTSAYGLALLACEAIERSNDARRFWLVASTTPWEYLEEWLADDLRIIYKRAAKTRKKDKKALKGIEAASSRRELE